MEGGAFGFGFCGVEGWHGCRGATRRSLPQLNDRRYSAIMPDDVLKLSYAISPVQGNTIVTSRPGGVTIEVLPDRRMIRRAELTLVICVGVFLFVSAWAGFHAWQHPGDWSFFAMAVIGGPFFVLKPFRELFELHSHIHIDADRSGIRFSVRRWVEVPFRKMPDRQWSHEQLMDVAAVRRKKSKSGGMNFNLILRLRDGQSISLLAGGEVFIRDLASRIQQTITTRPTPDLAGWGLRHPGRRR